MKIINLSVGEVKERLQKIGLLEGDQYGHYTTYLEPDHIESILRELSKPSQFAS